MKYRCIVSFLITVPVTLHSAQVQSGAESAPPADQKATITASSECGAGATYDQITDAWRHPTWPQKIPMGTAPIKLTVQSIEFDDRPVTAKMVSLPGFCWQRTLSVGVNISTAGEAYAFANGEGSYRGGGGGKLPAETIARLQLLMDKLPGDDHRVPPPGRRVLVSVREGRTATVRLYDSENLPDSIVEMIRLTDARITIVTPVLQSDKTWAPEEVKGLDFPPPMAIIPKALYVSPDRTIGVLHDFATNTLTVYEGNSWPEIAPTQGKKIIREIREFWQPPLPYGYSVNGEFSPDGRYLLVTWGNRIGALLYDTRTWEPVTDPHLFPQTLKEYLHSPDWSLGVAVTNAGEALVWDQKSHRVLSKLQGLGELEPASMALDQNSRRIYDIPSGEIRSAAFSPDRTRVAIYSGPDNQHKLRLSVWDIKSGDRLRDFWPVEWMSFPDGQPLWWNNGQWLVAPYSSEFSKAGVGLWDADTGRFKGTLSSMGCEPRESLLVVSNKLLQRCLAGPDKDGEVLEWSVEGVKKQLETAAVRLSIVESSPK